MEAKGEGAITERPTKNPFYKAVNKLGFVFGSEFTVPDNLHHEVEQPLGVKVMLEGPRDNLRVLCKTSSFAILLNDIAPQDTIFAIQRPKEEEDAKILDFESSAATERVKKVLIPCNLGLLRDETIFATIHELSHLWQREDLEWLNMQINAEKLLTDENTKKRIPVFYFSSDHEKRQKQIDASKMLDKEESRASETALYIIGRLRSHGIDVLPQYPNVRSLMHVVNVRLRDYQEFDQKLTLDEKKVESLLNGSLPYTDIKEKIDTRITKVVLNARAS
jgi:hypothetical protein